MRSCRSARCSYKRKTFCHLKWGLALSPLSVYVHVAGPDRCMPRLSGRIHLWCDNLFTEKINTDDGWGGGGRRACWLEGVLDTEKSIHPRSLHSNVWLECQDKRSVSHDRVLYLDPSEHHKRDLQVSLQDRFSKIIPWQLSSESLFEKLFLLKLTTVVCIVMCYPWSQLVSWDYLVYTRLKTSRMIMTPHCITSG